MIFKYILNFWPNLFKKLLGIIHIENQQKQLQAEIEKILALEEAHFTLLKIKAGQIDDYLLKLDKRTHDLVNIGVDVHFQAPHQIMVWSALNGGQFRMIEITLDNMQDLRNLVYDIKMRYGVRQQTLWDAERDAQHHLIETEKRDWGLK